MKKSALFLSGIVGLLTLLGIGFSVRFLLVGGANEGFEEFPAVTLAHVIPGIVYLTLAPLQFIESLRRNYASVHRWSGRLLVSIGFVAGAAALFIGIIFPYSGTVEQIVVGGFGTFNLFSIATGFARARARNFPAHREWMIRAYAIGLSIVTMRLIFIPILIAIGSPTRDEAALFSIVSFTVAFIVHGVFAEWWIRYSRNSRRRPAYLQGEITGTL